MTIAQAISGIDSLKPNSYTTAQKIAWLNELDGLVWKEHYETHEPNEDETWPTHFDGYDSDTATTTPLLVPSPYDGVYLFWLASQIDLWNQEYDKYNNNKTLYNNAYMTYSDWFTRTHMPKDAGGINF